ncbi:MAG TPA: nitrophenyl compound nitroreductase subunit ArsF family protein [Phycisphaerae bacterium]|nr:nitrophenyl compound nitroreductase subunit ArsF family protein [Phycisphaerae bacterium]HRR86060.1 nitrophenyl compound nitroreductase subunit ArsF family protein [Phycisphaerae bacterium]
MIRPCQQCDGAYPIGMWMSALLICMLVIAWKHWPRMGRIGRVGMIAVCMVVFGGSIATSYWQHTSGSTDGACGTYFTPILPPPATGPSSQPMMGAATVASQPVAESFVFEASPDVGAFYFHRTVRCHSCLQIEEWARQVIETYFGEELAGGLIEWRPVNIDEPGNEHFEKDYRLTTQSLVLVRMIDGRPAEWKNLKSVWEFLGDYAAMTEYVRSELSAFLHDVYGM